MSVSTEELTAEQEIALKPLSDMIYSMKKVQDWENGYFLQGGVLLRKRTRTVDYVKVNQVTQMVMALKFRKLVLSIYD